MFRRNKQFLNEALVSRIRDLEAENDRLREQLAKEKARNLRLKQKLIRALTEERGTE